MAAGGNGSWSGGGASDGELLVDTADRLRWRAPELALEFARQAAVQADTAQDRALSLRARALMVAALVRLGKHAEAVQPAVLALREAESVGLRDFAAPIRVDLAASTRAVGLAGSAFVLVRPMLEGGDARPAVRAGALAEIVAGLAQAGRRTVADEVLSEADRLYSGDESLTGDIRRVLRALLCARTSSFRRRWGNPEAAVAAATEGMMLLDGLSDARVESGQARAELGLEMVTALLDAGEKAAALGQADQTLEQPVRAPTAAAVGRLMFILATRVYLPDGRVPEAHAAFAEIVRIARRHGLDALLADVLTSLAHEQEAAGELTDALESLRSARAAEHRRLRADTMARLIVLEELGAGTKLPADTESLLRRVVRTPARAAELAVGEPLWPEQSTEDTGDRDSETGLLNRQGLRRRLAAARRQARPTALTLVRFEPEPEPPLRSDDPDSTDRFSASLIDSLDKTGRRAAPEVDPGVLSSLAGHVSDMAPDRAELVRSNEDELAVLMPDTTRDEAEQFASSLRDNMSTSDWAPDDPAWGVHLSTGVAEYQDGTSEDTLLNAAREAMTSNDFEIGDNAERPAWQSVEPVYDLPPEDVPFGDVESRGDGYTYIEEYGQGPADEPERDPEMDAYLAGFSLPEYGQWTAASPDQDVEPDAPAPKHGAASDTPGQSVLDRLGITQGGGSGGGRRRAPDAFAQDTPPDDYTPPPSGPTPSTEPWLDETQPPGDDTDTPSRGFNLTAPTNKDDEQTPSPQPRGRRYRQTPDTPAEPDPGGLGDFQQNATPDPGPVPDDPLPRRRFEPESGSMVFNDPLGLDEYHRSMSSGISPESSSTNLFAAGDDDLPEVGTGSRRDLSGAFGTSRTPGSGLTDEEQTGDEPGPAFNGGFPSGITGFGPVERASAEAGADSPGLFRSAGSAEFGLVEGDSAARDTDSSSPGLGQSGLRRRLGRRFGGGAAADSGSALSDQDSGSRRLPGTDGLDAMRGRRRSRRMDPEGADTGEQSDSGPGGLAGLAGLTSLSDTSPGGLGFPASGGWPTEPPGINDTDEDNAGRQTRPRFEPVNAEIVGAQFNPEYDTYLPDLDQIRKSGSAGDAVLAAASSRASIPEPPQPEEIPVPPPTPDIPTSPNPDTDPTHTPKPSPTPKPHPDHPATPPAETRWTSSPETETPHPTPTWPSAFTPNTTHPDNPTHPSNTAHPDNPTHPSNTAHPGNPTHPEPPSPPSLTWPSTPTAEPAHPEPLAPPAAAHRADWHLTPEPPAAPTSAHRTDWHLTPEPEAANPEPPTTADYGRRARRAMPEPDQADHPEPSALTTPSHRSDHQPPTEPDADRLGRPTFADQPERPTFADQPERPTFADPESRSERRSTPDTTIARFEGAPFADTGQELDWQSRSELEALRRALSDFADLESGPGWPSDPEPQALQPKRPASAEQQPRFDPQPPPNSELAPHPPEPPTRPDLRGMLDPRPAPESEAVAPSEEPTPTTPERHRDWRTTPQEKTAEPEPPIGYDTTQTSPRSTTPAHPTTDEYPGISDLGRSDARPEANGVEPRDRYLSDGESSRTGSASGPETDESEYRGLRRAGARSAADGVDTQDEYPGLNDFGRSRRRLGSETEGTQSEPPESVRLGRLGRRVVSAWEAGQSEPEAAEPRNQPSPEPQNAPNFESGRQTNFEHGRQTSSESGRQARFQPGDQLAAESERQAGSGSGRRAAAESERQLGFESGRQAGAESEHQATSETGRRAEVESGRQMGSEFGRRARAESERQTGAESGRRSGAESGRQLGSESGRRRARSESGSDLWSRFESGSDSSSSLISGRRSAYELEASLRSDESRSRQDANAGADSGRAAAGAADTRRVESGAGRGESGGRPDSGSAGRRDVGEQGSELGESSGVREGGRRLNSDSEARSGVASDGASGGTVLRPVFDPESARRMASQGGRVISPDPREASDGPELPGAPQQQGTVELPRTAELRDGRARGESGGQLRGTPESRGDRAPDELGAGSAAELASTTGLRGERAPGGLGAGSAPELAGTGEWVNGEPAVQARPQMAGTAEARGERVQGAPVAPSGPEMADTAQTRDERVRGEAEAEPRGTAQMRSESGAQVGAELRGTAQTRGESGAQAGAELEGAAQARDERVQGEPGAQAGAELGGTAEARVGRVQGEGGAQGQGGLGEGRSGEGSSGEGGAGDGGAGEGGEVAAAAAVDRSAWRRQLGSREGSAERSAWRRELRNRAAGAGARGDDAARQQREGIDSGSDSDGAPGRALPPEPADPVDPLGSAESPESAGRPSRLRRREKTDVGLAELLAEALVAYQTSHSDTEVEDVLPPYDDPSDSGRHRPAD